MSANTHHFGDMEFADHPGPYPKQGCRCYVCRSWRRKNAMSSRPIRRKPSGTIGEGATYRILAATLGGETADVEARNIYSDPRDRPSDG